MASLLSLSANPPTLRNSLTFLSTPFKGSINNLMPIRPLKLQRNRTSLNVFNQAASSTVVSDPVTNVRFRLNNLGPQPDSRKRGKRKGRGISAGQGNCCGFGMRGQKSRSGPGVRNSFESGQMPLNSQGLPKYVPINLKGIAEAGFLDGEEVSLETLKKGLINPSGRERRLPLKDPFLKPEQKKAHTSSSTK